MIGRLPGTLPGRPKTSQNLPGELPRSPRPLRGPSRTPRTSWEHVQAPHLSRQSVPGQLIDHVVGFGDRPTSPGVGLGGVTCSGFGSAASAVRPFNPPYPTDTWRLWRITFVHRFPGEVYLPLPLRRPNHCRRPGIPPAFGTRRLLLERDARYCCRPRQA